MQIHLKRLMVSNFEILTIVASFYAIDWHNRRMLIFIIISATVAVLTHKALMTSVNNYEYYGSSTTRQEWINFEREKLGH